MAKTHGCESLERIAILNLLHPDGQQPQDRTIDVRPQRVDLHVWALLEILHRLRQESLLRRLWHHLMDTDQPMAELAVDGA